MHWGSIRSLVFGLPSDIFSAEVSKAQRDILKCTRSGSRFFFIEYGRLYVGKSDCEYEQIIIYLCFIFPQAICNFSFKCIHFSYGASLCAQLSYTSRAISPFLFISLWFRFSFCFQRCYLIMIQCMFFLSSTSWRLTRNWCLTRRIQMRDHHLISCCWEWRSWWRRTLFTWI